MVSNSQSYNRECPWFRKDLRDKNLFFGTPIASFTKKTKIFEKH
jgi:hypothetical protein